MKIVYISNSTIPSRTANSIHVMKMCQAFAKNGHEVILLAPDLSSGVETNGDDLFGYYGVDRCFEVRKLPIIKKRGLAQIYTFMIMFQLLKIRPELVYGRYFHGCYVAVLMGYHTIQESHSKDWVNSRSKKYMLERLEKSKNLIRFVVITEALKDLYLEQFPGLSEKMVVAQDGADVCSSDPSDFDLKLDRHRLQVGYTGHLYEGRGVDILLQTARLMGDVDFHIVGGMDKDVGFWQSQNPSSNIHFHGFVEPSLVKDYQRQFDVLLAPYQRKVMTNGKEDTSMCMSPLKIFEYMASKKPIIASNLPVLQEVLNEGNSMQVNPDDPNEWVDAINALKDEKRRKKLAENAYSCFLRNYTWNQRAKLVLSGVMN